MYPFVEYFLVRKFLLSLREHSSFADGSVDEVIGGLWDTSRFGVIPLGLAKPHSKGFLGFVTSGLPNF